MSTDFFITEDNNSDPMQTGFNDGIKLPFPTLFFSWRNGDPALDELGENNVKYTGGWEMNEKNYENVKANFPNLPLYFKPTTFKGKTENYNAFVTKQIAVVPVGMRERSLMKVDGRDVPVKRFTKGSKSHLQMIAFMADFSEGAYKPYGAVILSAKSNSAAAVKSAFTTFDAQTKDLRSSIKVPYYRFFIRIGIGTPKFETVGRGNDTHDITPCQLIAPQAGWTMDALKAAYIGKDVIEQISTLQIAAAEWLNDKAWMNGDAQAAPVQPLIPAEQVF